MAAPALFFAFNKKKVKLEFALAATGLKKGHKVKIVGSAVDSYWTGEVVKEIRVDGEGRTVGLLRVEVSPRPKGIGGGVIPKSGGVDDLTITVTSGPDPETGPVVVTHGIGGAEIYDIP